MKFSALSSTTLAALVISVMASPANTLSKTTSNEVGSTIDNIDSNTIIPRLITIEEFKEWLATTDANVTFIGDPISSIAPRSAQNTIVTYCNKRSQNVCGGACTVYNGGAKCLSAPGTQCLSATQNVAFCNRGGCGGTCNQFSSCGTRMDNNFCWTPGTQSIIVGA
ncbi:hypothetical protein BDZ94DRAFT_1232229 [Collybia nuda]|uniref:Uncharacterized protein n=1 Tax=Collybia nuda TaxID=64659 RepID=A0A9P5YGV8_9AGAR|nr:hypothetical protein BDZ94DRAFT_1232229 [Collybia nuda]